MREGGGEGGGRGGGGGRQDREIMSWVWRLEWKMSICQLGH